MKVHNIREEREMRQADRHAERGDGEEMRRKPIKIHLITEKKE